MSETENSIVLSDGTGVNIAHCSKQGKSLKDIRPYLDNSEYEWGHNVKHTNEEEL